MAEKVKFRRGTSTTLPSEKVPGTIYITTDTGEMFVDDTTDSRVRVNTQSDYTQNDSTAADYIKNRPFYSEGFSDVTLLDGTFDFVEDHTLCIYEQESSLTFEEGKTYTVVFDGTSYSCIGYIPMEGVPVLLGNASLVGLSGGNNEPFSVLVSGLRLRINTTLTGASHTVKITASEEVVKKKLDAKYLPDEIRETPSSKMDKQNPTGTGSFSLNRKAGTTIGNYSHAEGSGTTASGQCSHAEGDSTTASGGQSHAEGSGTKASSDSQHVQGRYNIEDSSATYADIIGNGNSVARSNAATVDWSGNAWYAGDVYVGSTSGTNKDAGSKKLATEEYVQSMLSSGGVTVDVAMSDTSVHPVQNKVIKTYVDSLIIDDGSID